MKEILLTEKKDGIPCVIIFPWLEKTVRRSAVGREDLKP